MTIIEQARELLDRESEWPIHSPILVAVCRALIARDEALHETTDALENAATWADDSDDPDGEDAARHFRAIVGRARRALTDDGLPREG